MAPRPAPALDDRIVESPADFSGRFKSWRANDGLDNYPFIENTNAPFTPMRRALPMLNLALISSAGAFIDGTESFDITSRDGDAGFKEIPIEVEAEDLLFAARGYDPAAVLQDINCQIPIERLLEYEANGVIGRLNHVWWSLSSYIPNARLVAEQIAPQIAERICAFTKCKPHCSFRLRVCVIKRSASSPANSNKKAFRQLCSRLIAALPTKFAAAHCLLRWRIRRGRRQTELETVSTARFGRNFALD